MTTRHKKLEADLEIVQNLLHKRYANGRGLDYGTKNLLIKREKELKALLKLQQSNQ